MEFAFTFGVTFLDKRTAATRCRLARVQRLSGLSFRDSARSAGTLAANWFVAGTPSAAGTLRKS